MQRKPHALVVTDFVACLGCRAMYFAPFPKAPDPPSQATAIGSGGGPQPGHRGSLLGPRVDLPALSPAPSPEEHQRLMEAVARANKGKHKGRRG